MERFPTHHFHKMILKNVQIMSDNVNKDVKKLKKNGCCYVIENCTECNVYEFIQVVKLDHSISLLLKIFRIKS